MDNGERWNGSYLYISYVPTVAGVDTLDDGRDLEGGPTSLVLQ